MTDKELDTLLQAALCPEIDPMDTIVHPRKGTTMKGLKLYKRAAVAAAAILLLVTTTFASGLVKVTSLVSGGGTSVYSTYAQMENAQKKAGFQMDIPETMQGGYEFVKADISGTNALDQNDEKLFSYQSLRVLYETSDGHRLYLSAHEKQEGIETGSSPVLASSEWRGIRAEYRLDHYKVVPEDYQLTEADEENLKKPNYQISFGSDEIEEQDIAFVTWQKNGIDYLLMEMGASLTPDAMLAIAGEVIHS